MTLLCPSCRAEVLPDSAPGNGAERRHTCRSQDCGYELPIIDNILRALAPDRRPFFERFLCDYMKIRHAEGRGSHDPAYYRALPFEDLTGRNAEQWRMRAVTWRYVESRLLPPQPIDVLDLGAGNAWLSNRLAQRGHRPVAVDIFTDPLDGLAAARHYATPFPLVEAEFDRLPFADAQFDWAVFNSSFHYSADYRRTLAEAQRCLRPQGRIVILDSPIYKQREHGERMREERHRQFEKLYGFRSDSIPSIEFLWEALLDELARELRLRWRIDRPWYGWQWHARPWKAKLAGRRPPSRFWILTGSARA